jgi:hypothetical protein
MSLGGAFSIIGVGPQGVYKAKAGGGAPANTARTQAFLTASGITDPQIINALNAMDLSLISAGLLPSGTGAGKIKALYPIVGGTAATHKFNFVNPLDTNAAFRLVFFGGWTHSANGMTPNGTNAYANTFLFQNTLGQNSQHLACYVRQNSTSSNAGFGIFNSETWLLLRPSVIYGNINDSDYSTSTNSNAGYFLSTRTASNSRKTYRNGSTIITSTSSSNANASLSFYIGTLNQAGSPGAFYDNNQFAFANYGEGLTDAENTNLYNLVQAFQTALGRQV